MHVAPPVMLLLLACAGAAPASGALAYEWAGSFLTPELAYTWTAQKVNGEYADPTMLLVLVSITDDAQATLDGVLETGKAAITGSCPGAATGSTLIPTPTGACYNLTFSPNEWQSFYTITPAGASAIAFIAQHVPTEFEATAHYLKDPVSGADIEPGAELKLPVNVPWGTGIGAAILVNLVTFSGIVLLAPGLNALVKKNMTLFIGSMSAFAAGALLAAALFLLLFEGVHLVGTLDASESAHTFRWGVVILCGFITSFVIDIVVQTLAPAAAHAPQTATRTDAEAGKGEVAPAQIEISSLSTLDTPAHRLRVLSAILIGDFFHNFADGIFMGTAFLHCSSSLAWSITTATVFHEIAQEVADYVVLTSLLDLKPRHALGINFISGTSVILGTIVIFSIETLDDYATGMLLAYGGGLYLQIGATECMPRVFEACKNVSERLLCLGTFCLGCLLIGLVLLDHQHCSAGGHGH